MERTEMDYWEVHWLHDFEAEPVAFFSAIGEDGYEVRKVQEYRDGRRLRTDAQHESGDVWLSEIPVGSINDVQSQPEFTARTITQDEFEEVWRQASWAS